MFYKVCVFVCVFVCGSSRLFLCMPSTEGTVPFY